MAPAIRVENLGKMYQIAHNAERLRYKTLRESLTNALMIPINRLRNKGESIHQEDFWALSDVSFEVQPGDVVGIIGRNGAGKSTLLKILSRITKPTKGRVEINGRVGSLLEVGTGFHPELTGRENVFLNGSILGMKREEIARQFDEIVAFAEVERFIDTPVKRYSSGMYVRLAFAVAAHLQPEILIVDEVLAVGDAQFQQKCLGKMGEVSRQGRTVLFVSHNSVAIRNLCRTGVWLDRGKIAEKGASATVLSNYINSGSGTIMQGAIQYSVTDAPGNDVIRLRGLKLSVDGEVTGLVPIDKPLDITIDYECCKAGAALSVSLHLFDQNSTCVFVTGTQSKSENLGVHRTNCRIPANFLNDIRYSLKVILVEDITKTYHCENSVVSFDGYDSGSARGGFYGKMLGVVRPTLEWSTPSPA